LVGTTDNDGGIGAAVVQEQHGAWFGIAAAIETDDYTIADLRLLAELGFEVGGINVQSRGRDDDIFLAALEIEISLGIEFAEIAGAKPALLVPDGMYFTALPVAAGHASAAHENFAVAGQLDLATRKDFSDRFLADGKWVVQADQGGRFGEAVALYDAEAHASPELFGFGIERGAAGDECPKLPTEEAMDLSHPPPAHEKVPAIGSRPRLPELREFALRFEVAFDFVLEGLKNARNGDQNADALLLDGANEVARVQRGWEEHGGAEQVGNEDAEKLAEDVT